MTAVATFYSMYRRTPTGEYLVGVCTNTLCAIMGGDAILDALEDHLGVHAGQTTDDGQVTLEHIECNAACDYAPVVMVNWEFFDNQTPSSHVISSTALRSGDSCPSHPRRAAVHVPPDRPHPRGPARRPADPADGQVPTATLAGLRVAHELDMEAPPPPEGEQRRHRRSPTTPRRRPSRPPKTNRHPRRRPPCPPNRPPPKPTRAKRIHATDMAPATPLTPVLSRYWDDPEPWSLDTYRRHDGYRALDKALAMDPDDVIALVKDSGLRGRGGAGFPTGTKWSFIPQDDTGAGAKPHYLVINADESEPGTCKDIPLMLTTPHFLVEGAIIAAYAIRAHHAFIYVRGEVVPVLRRLQAAVAEAYAAGYLGTDIWARASTWSSSCTPGRAPTSAARRPRCSTRWRAGAASPGCGRRSPRSPVCTPARRW